jgi:hypothetical protein
MPALMGDNGFERKVIWIGIALERLGVNGQQVLLWRSRQPKLGAASLTNDMAVLHAAYETQSASDLQDSALASHMLGCRDRCRMRMGH